MRTFKIKICGITNAADAAHAVDAGADAIGLNFYQRSLRSVTPFDALEIISALPNKPTLVGVFVNESTAEILELSAHLQLDAVQLHGDETPDIMAHLDSVSVIRAVRIQDNSVAAITAIQSEIDAWCEAGVSAILIDKASGKSYGGTGETFDWTIVRRLNVPVQLILAGGLEPGNVATAISTATPDTVDVASGVERFPGGKDPELTEQFVKSALTAFDQID